MQRKHSLVASGLGMAAIVALSDCDLPHGLVTRFGVKIRRKWVSV